MVWRWYGERHMQARVLPRCRLHGTGLAHRRRRVPTGLTIDNSQMIPAASGSRGSVWGNAEHSVFGFMGQRGRHAERVARRWTAAHTGGGQAQTRGHTNQ